MNFEALNETIWFSQDNDFFISSGIVMLYH